LFTKNIKEVIISKILDKVNIMNISLLKENYEKYKDLKNELDNLTDYGWPASFALVIAFISFLMAINITELMPIPLAIFSGLIGSLICIPIGIELVKAWNLKKRKYKNINDIEKFGYNMMGDVLYLPSKLNKIEEKYKKINSIPDFDIVNLRNVDVNTEYSFVLSAIKIDLEKKENEVTEDLEFFILNELLDDDKIKIYKKYLNKKLNNISKLEILGQKDDIINKIISTDFSQKEKLGLINLLENKIKQKAEEDFENSIQEKLKSIEESALKLKENTSVNVNKNKIVKSL
tara:strand:- start:6223 stop:7092 length:870 start_codon:yes stop_codon:yes gene_type:complete